MVTNRVGYVAAFGVAVRPRTLTPKAETVRVVRVTIKKTIPQPD
jgi:hypothetical protein